MSVFSHIFHRLLIKILIVPLLDTPGTRKTVVGEYVLDISVIVWFMSLSPAPFSPSPSPASCNGGAGKGPGADRFEPITKQTFCVPQQ